jgi:hypothetical protein
MSSERVEIINTVGKGIFKLQSSVKGTKEYEIKELTTKRNQALIKVLNSAVNPNPKQTAQERLFQEKCQCIFILQYTDQLIQYQSAIASENFWEQQRKDNSSQ